MEYAPKLNILYVSPPEIKSLRAWLAAIEAKKNQEK